MKRIFLIRHGKSSWDNPELSDKERPLKKRGKQDAELMGKVLKKHGVRAQHILSSPAERARATAKRIAAEIAFEKKIEISKLLYMEGVENIFEAIRTLDDKTATAFLVGHNPDFTELLNRLSEKDIENMPTCGVAGVEFDIQSWKQAAFGNGRMFFYDFPSRHR